MRALLDINVLLALLDADHVDHAATRSWLSERIGSGWASCPITENGFTRVISLPSYPGAIPPAEAIERLRRATGTSYHVFWPCDLSLLDETLFDRSRLHGPRQVTDAYLLALAVAHQGRFVTFDQGVPLAAVRGANPGHLMVL
jgi:toxin-antitoxin system PIN domain toxin